MKTTLALILLSIAAQGIVAAGCGDVTESLSSLTTCQSATTRDCRCTNGANGVQICSPDGSWQVCVCSDLDTCDAGMAVDGGCDTYDPCVNGTCAVDEDGYYTCACDIGWDGEHCDECAAGYVLHGESCDIRCGPASTMGLDCGENGTCVDDDGPAECQCDTGFSGAGCEICADDAYEQNDQDSTASVLDLAPEATFIESGLAICEADEDWFVVDLAPPDIVTVTVEFTHADGDLDLDLYYLYEAAGQKMAFSHSQTDDESVTYEIVSGERGAYLIKVSGAGTEFARNDYNLEIFRDGPDCYTCAYLDVSCGVWDDNCSGTLDCDAQCPGIATDEAVCEQYEENATCAEYFDDLVYGCCEGTTLYKSFSWGNLEADCATEFPGTVCGWSVENNGVFCVDSEIVDDAGVPNDGGVPPGIVLDCPDWMTWAL